MDILIPIKLGIKEKGNLFRDLFFFSPKKIIVCCSKKQSIVILFSTKTKYYILCKTI
jgi:hypothetical protein